LSILIYTVFLILDGINIYDAFSRRNIILHCYTILWTGDIPAVSKIMCLSGHNAYLGCRFCYLKGIYCQNSRHVYYPCNMPRGRKNSNYDPENLNKRTETSFRRDITNIENAETIGAQNACKKETGKW